MSRPLPPLPTSRLRARVRRSPARAIALALVLALLATLAQTLGLAHRQAHGHDAPRVTASPRFDGQAAHSGSHAASWLPALFAAHDEDSAECRLLDQLLHAGALLAVAAPTAAPPPAGPAASPQAAGHRRAATHGHLARGPPAG